MKNLTDMELLKFPTNSFAFFTQSQDLIKKQMKLLVLLKCMAVYLSREAPVDKQPYLPLQFPNQALRLLQKTNLRKC